MDDNSQHEATKDEIIKKLQKELDAEIAKNKNTVYFNYLHNIQIQIPPILHVETDRKQAALGKAGKADGKMYPRALRRWEDFPQLHRRSFDLLTTLFGDNILFPSYNDTQDEQDIRPFIRAYLEVPSMLIVGKFLRRTDDPKYAGLEFEFSNNAHGMSARKIHRSRSSASAANRAVRGSATASHAKHKFNSPSTLAPDRWGLRVRRDASDEDATVSESILPGGYKAARKLRGDSIRHILGNDDLPPAESLIDDCAQRRRHTADDADDADGGGGGLGQQNPPSADSNRASAKRQQDEMIIAEVLCQAYHYMVVYGTKYGYATSGEGTVFLMIAPESPDALIYHFVAHADPAAPITRPADDLVHVPAAQMVTLVLEALVADLRDQATTTALLQDLPRWPDPKTKKKRLTASPAIQRGRSLRRDGDDDNNDNSGMSGGRDRSDEMPPPPPPAHGGGSGGAVQPGTGGASGPSRTFDRFERPRQEYCTQACLLGLCHGGPLDPHCPNTPEHARGEHQKIDADGQQCHAISTAELCAMLLEQLTCSLSAGIECLMKYGLFGAIGTLFKVTLCAYGYTFVAKGAQDADQQALKNEAAIYINPATQQLQGVLMPVYLGWVELEEWPYILSSGACVWHMMLLSWAGVSLERRVPEAVDDVDDVLEDVRDELYCHGIYHRDIHPGNVAWNKELQQGMAIDFDRAFVMDEGDYEQGCEESPPLPETAKAESVGKVETDGAPGTPDGSRAEKRKLGAIGQDGDKGKRLRA